jgi:cobalt/nickel transport system permease protein
VIALSSEFHVLTAGFAFSLVTLAAARIELKVIAKRLLTLNIFMLFLFVIVPFSTPGQSVFTLGTFQWTLEGLFLAIRITLRANAIVTAYSALVSTMSPVVLGHALHRLGLPSMLVQMMFFTVRYVAVLIDEYQRKLRAMKIRGFRNALSAHTLRSYGYLIGALLISSFERSERISAAMKCRGYKGQFHLLDQLHVRTADAMFACASLSIFVILGVVEWM